MNVHKKLIYAVLLLVVVTAGNAFAADGASGGYSFLDMILLGLVVFLVFRLFRRRSGRWGNPHDGQYGNDQDDQGRQGMHPPQNRHEHAQAMWDILSDSGEQQASPKVVNSDGFNQAEFLEGAKMFYSRFQEARDAGNWDVVGSFISPGLLDDLKRDAGASETVRSEIMLLEAKVMDVRTENGKTDVTVFFDALMRRGQSGEQEVSERTAWEFSRPEHDSDALWVLERINKIDH